MDEELAKGELLLNDRKNSKLIPIITTFMAIILVGLALFYYLFGCAVVDGHSMENSLQDDQRAVLLTRGYDIDRGDIVTLNHPKEKDAMLIKRVIGLGGDKLLFVVTENGQEVDLYRAGPNDKHFSLVEEPYIKERMRSGERFDYGIVKLTPYAHREKIESAIFGTAEAQYYIYRSFTVPKDSIFFLGDNRNNSTDSRYYGPSSIDKITGKCIKIVDKNSALEGFMNLMFGL